MLTEAQQKQNCTLVHLVCNFSWMRGATNICSPLNRLLQSGVRHRPLLNHLSLKTFEGGLARWVCSHCSLCEDGYVLTAPIATAHYYSKYLGYYHECNTYSNIPRTVATTTMPISNSSHYNDGDCEHTRCAPSVSLNTVPA